MKQAKISDLKNQLSRYLDLVRKGETVRVFDRNRPVADIVPIERGRKSAHGEDDPLLDVMERKGLVRRGTGRIAPEILRNNPRGEPCGVLEALLEERRRR
ncbi:MAG: hypothetical protein KatS3mg076_1552 [Candidatus Binatia bacterium]|nr:MAG: hypothetical protein KatS3mg076_1552 [Candidatus Binatia bacterium]